MNETLFSFLNIFFFVFHGSLILFNVFGWIFPRTRRWNLITLLATGASWFILGTWKGWGYCLCTDWHWQVRRALGLEVETSSYIDFLLIKWFDLHLPLKIVDGGTLVILLVSLSLSIWLNWRDFMERRSNQ